MTAFVKQTETNNVLATQVEQPRMLGQAPVQHIVNDRVTCKPSLDPYQAITEAAKRLSEGKSVFSVALK